MHSQGLITTARMDVSLQSGNKTKLGTKQDALSPWKAVSKQTITTRVHTINMLPQV